MIAAIAFYVTLGAIVAHTSMTMHPRFLKRADAVNSQLAILDRTTAHFDGAPDDIRNWRNRVIVPYAMEGLHRAFGLSATEAYILLRWFTASAAFALFGLAVSRQLNAPTEFGMGAALLLAVCFLPTFLHIYEIPSDFLDAAFFSVLTLLAIARKRTWFAVTMTIALLNRESAIFAVPVWFCAGIKFPPTLRSIIRDVLWCTGLAMAGTALVVAIRILNCEQTPTITHALQSFDPFGMWQTNARMVRDFVHHPSYSSPLFYLPCYVVLFVAAVAGSWADISPLSRRLTVASVAIFLVSIIANNIDELRIFVPSIVLNSFVLADICWSRFRAAPPVAAAA